jgi:Holliday junction resolvase RusA-like endonuclease
MNNVENDIRITLPLPISVNVAYCWKTRRFKSKVYKEWEERAIEALNKQNKYVIKWDEWLHVTYVFNTKIICKNGNKRIWDVFNHEKVLSDFLSHNLEWFDDHKIKQGVVIKNNSKLDTVDITIKEIVWQNQ